VIIQISRMEKWKGHEVHLQALSLLRSMPQWTCWFVGGAQRPSEVRYVEALKDQVVKLGLQDRVVFCGHRSDIARLLNAADIYCQPNLDPEPFGLSLVEALHARRPVIATNVGGPKEIIDESCGFLVPPGDADAVAAALRLLIENGHLRRRVGAAGPARASGLCDLSSQMHLLEDRFIKLLNNRISAPSSMLYHTQRA
jgi:glycosyltransferase involved in cell wall biosynthesis